jgi:hypothetical protein
LSKIFRLNETALSIGKQSIILKTSEALGWQNLNVSLVGGPSPKSLVVQRTVPALWIAMGIDPVEIEGIIDSKNDIIGVTFCPETTNESGNKILIYENFIKSIIRSKGEKNAKKKRY